MVTHRQVNEKSQSQWNVLAFSEEWKGHGSEEVNCSDRNRKIWQGYDLFLFWTIVIGWFCRTFPLFSSIFDWIIMIYDVFKSKTMMGRGQVIVKGNWAKEIKINSELEVLLLEELLMCTASAHLPSGRIGVHYMFVDTILTSLFSVYCKMFSNDWARKKHFLLIKFK